MSNVIECVIFKLNENVGVDEFKLAAKASDAFVTEQPGFISRRLSTSENGHWIEHIEWASMQDAQNAASKIDSDPRTQALIQAIKGDTVQMFHAESVIAIG